MFASIGEKIKIIAKIFAVAGVLISTVGGFWLMSSGYGNEIKGLVLLFAGALGSLVAAFLIYGFGHLIINSDITARTLNPKEYYYRQEYAEEPSDEEADD